MRQGRLSGKSVALPRGGRGPQLVCLLVVVLLSACGGGDFNDLQQYISRVKARPKGAIDKLPEPKAIEFFSFKPEQIRDPFKPAEQPEAFENIGPDTGSGLKPDFSRRKEELEVFPLDGLKMVGTVNMKSKLWGLVQASDKTVHRVQVGNYMGKNFGKIIRISIDRIELMEILPDKPGTWREQQTSLTLAE